MREQLNTKIYDIFDYQKDKCITNEGNVEIEIGYEGHDETKANVDNSIPVIEDWGEPCCFACGCSTGIYVQDDDLKKCWNSVKHLQRCHIVPDALGGSVQPENLFLLCRDCHRDSPDTIYKKEFFKFVFNRRKEGTIERRALSKALIRAKQENIPYQLFDVKHDWKLDKTIGTHSGFIVESTLTAALLGGAKEKFEALNALISKKSNNKLQLEVTNGNLEVKEKQND